MIRLLRFLFHVEQKLCYNKYMETQRTAGGNELLDSEDILKDILELPYGASVADLGTGSMAFFTLQAAKIVGDKGVVYGLDIVKEVLSSVAGKAKQEGLINIKTVWTNLEVVGAAQIPPVDYTLLVNTVFQGQNRQAMFNEAYRLTKPEGKLLFVDWKPAVGAVGPAAGIRIRPEKAEALALNAGFVKVKDFEAGINHYGMVFKK